MNLFQLENGTVTIPVDCTTDCKLTAGITMIRPNSTDAAKEKHVPKVQVDGNRISVNVGEVTHPMSEEHLITTVILETKNGGQFKRLSPDHEPIAEFILSEDDQPIEVYAYCNLHGMWSIKLSQV